MSVRPSSSPETSKYQLIRVIVQKPIRGYMSQPLINEILKHNEKNFLLTDKYSFIIILILIL